MPRHRGGAFTTAKDRRRLEAVIRRGIRSGFCAPDDISLEDLANDADDKLFNLIVLWRSALSASSSSSSASVTAVR